jgi:hypothetical protein
MRWRDRVNVIRRFYAEREASRLAVWRRAEAGRAVEDMPEDGIPSLWVDRGVAAIITYHESGESDEAFEGLRHEAAALGAAARLEPGRKAIDDSFVGSIRMRVELMYDEKTAERLMVAFECGCGPGGRPRSRRA